MTKSWRLQFLWQFLPDIIRAWKSEDSVKNFCFWGNASDQEDATIWIFNKGSTSDRNWKKYNFLISKKNNYFRKNDNFQFGDYFR